MSRRLIRLPVVIERTGLSKTTIYARVKVGAFLKPVNLGHALSAWVDARISERDGPSGDGPRP